MKTATAAATALLLAGLTWTANAQTSLSLRPGGAETIRTSRGARAVVIGNPEVAAANVISDQVVVLNARKDGRTNIILHDENGEEIYRADIIVGTPPVQIQRVIKYQGKRG